MIQNPARKLAFVLASTEHGAMILNRNDWHVTGNYGVGGELLECGVFSRDETNWLTGLVDIRRDHYGRGVRVIDGGANIGVFTVELARHMAGWGSVLAIEAQERLYYALAGNVAISNSLNASALWGALTEFGSVFVDVPV